MKYMRMLHLQIKTAVLLNIGRKRRLILTISGVMIPLILYILFSELINAYTFQTFQHLQRFARNGVLIQSEGDLDLSGLISSLEKNNLSYIYTLQRESDKVLRRRATYRGRPLILNMNVRILSGSIQNGFLPYQASGSLYVDRIKLRENKFLLPEIENGDIIPCMIEHSTALLLFGDDLPTGKIFSFRDDQSDHIFQVCGVIEDLPVTAGNNLQLNRDILISSSDDPAEVSCNLYTIRKENDHFPVTSSSCFFLFTEESFSEAYSITQRTDLHSGYTCLYDYDSILKQTEEYIRSVRTFGIPVLFLMTVISGLLIMNTMYFSIQERTKEIGIRRAVGAGVKNILFQFLFEGFCIGMISAFCACILSVLVLGILFLFMVWSAGTDLMPTLHFQTVLTVFQLSVIQTQIFSFLPSLHAARMQPSKALQDN